MRILYILFSLLPLSGRAEVSVVTSIEPLFQITRSIMRGVGKPELLIKRQASAHHFAFRPSHFRLLRDSDLVIWIDRHFEKGFQQLPLVLPERVLQLELLPALGLEQQDGHIWYSPVLLGRTTQHIQDALSRVDPEHVETYRRNAQELINRFVFWQQHSKPKIKAVNPRYLLDHDFLGHFENDMGIQSIGVLHDAREQSIGIRKLQLIEEKLTNQTAVCLLTNNITASKLAQNLAQKFSLKIYSIGRANPAPDDMSTIIQTLEQISSALVNCR